MGILQKNTVVKTNLTDSQWVDLGMLSQACITIPETCGSDGATMSVWLKIVECPPGGDVISSRPAKVTSWSLTCWGNNLV